MYDEFFFRTDDDLVRYVVDHGPSMPTLSGYQGTRNPILFGQMSQELFMLGETTRKGEKFKVKAIHLLLRETRKACRKDYCSVSPFFKPKGVFLWHANLEYGDARMPLTFVVANAFQGESFELCSKGGVFQMRFMGLGESLECRNGQGVVRFWNGLPVARERRDRGDRTIDHVDMVFSGARILNPCNDKANPAFAEFTSIVEDVVAETICEQPCYRIRLWSGPLAEPAGFPWTLLVTKSRVQKGYVPRVGDSVGGIAAMYGTFDEKQNNRVSPTVFQRRIISGELKLEPEIPPDEIPEAPKGKPEWEWLPRRPEDYPDAPEPRVSLPVFTDEPFKKFVTYPEYLSHIGDTLITVAPPSRKRLRGIIAEIDYKYTYVDDERWALGRIFNTIGIRHAVRDSATGETHLWLCIPLVDIQYDSHAELMITLAASGHVARYTLYSNSGDWAHEEMWCEVNRDGNHDYTLHPTADAALVDVPNIKKNGFVILCANCTGNMFQAVCTSSGSRKRYYAEWLLFGKCWCRGKKNVSEKRLLELCRLFLSGGLPAIQNEELWQKDQ